MDNYTSSSHSKKICLKDFQAVVKSKLDKSAYGYFAAGADE